MNSMKTTCLSLLLMSLLLSGCRNSRPDLTTEREEILELHRAQREYHFGGNAEAFAGQLSDDFISINGGEVTKPTRKEFKDRFQSYFSTVDFIRWDDIREPVVRFSDDGSLAYTVVQKEVVTRHENEEGNLVEERTRFAWTAVYRKTAGEWRIEHVASANGPSEISPVPKK